jgi:uncharacterized protein YcfJ
VHVHATQTQPVTALTMNINTKADHLNMPHLSQPLPEGVCVHVHAHQPHRVLQSVLLVVAVDVNLTAGSVTGSTTGSTVAGAAGSTTGSSTGSTTGTITSPTTGGTAGSTLNNGSLQHTTCEKKAGVTSNALVTTAASTTANEGTCSSSGSSSATAHPEAHAACCSRCNCQNHSSNALLNA